MKESELQYTLKNCSLHVLLMLASRVLTRSGFGDAQILDRRHVKQKSRFGGHEILCETAIGDATYRTIVKVVNDTGRLRMMDELAGSVIRTKADRGILITPRNLSAAARKHQRSYFGVKIEALTGEAFCDLLTRYGIGVRSKGSVDYAFFSALEDLSRRLLAFMREEAHD